MYIRFISKYICARRQPWQVISYPNVIHQTYIKVRVRLSRIHISFIRSYVFVSQIMKSLACNIRYVWYVRPHGAHRLLTIVVFIGFVFTSWHRGDETCLMRLHACTDHPTVLPLAWLSASLSLIIKYAITTIHLSRRIRARDATHTCVRTLHVRTYTHARMHTIRSNPQSFRPFLSHTFSLSLSLCFSSNKIY